MHQQMRIRKYRKENLDAYYCLFYHIINTIVVSKSIHILVWCFAWCHNYSASLLPLFIMFSSINQQGVYMWIYTCLTIPNYDMVILNLLDHIKIGRFIHLFITIYFIYVRMCFIVVFWFKCCTLVNKVLDE